MIIAFFRKFSLIALAAAAPACGSGDSKPDAAATATDSGGIVDGKSAPADGASPVDSKASADGKVTPNDTGSGGSVPEVTEKFWVAYNRVSALPGQTSQNDYVLTAWQNPAAGPGNGPSIFGSGVDPRDATKPAIQLTKVAFGTTGMSCQFGCYLSRDLKWMAVAKGAADAKGHYAYGLGSVNGDLVTKGLDKDAGLKDIKHLVFAGNYLFYSQKANCLGTGACQYDIHRRGPLGQSDLKDEVLTRMAPDNDPDVLESDTIYNGYFRVSDDGSTLTFLTPTIRSQRVYVWRGGNVAQLDYICPNWDGAKCVGTGSQYKDSDPVAVSVDGKRVVMFTIVDRWLRARKYEVGSETPSAFSNLVEVPAGKKYTIQANGAACGVLGPEQHVQVMYDPEFSLDSKRVWFVGYSNCVGASDKKWTDVMSIEVDKIGSELGADDWINWTKNPRDNSVKNKVIQGFSMSPNRQVIMLAATSSISGSGTAIGDADMRAKNDTEVYSLVAGSHTLVPVTNENGWLTVAPTTVLPISP